MPQSVLSISITGCKALRGPQASGSQRGVGTARKRASAVKDTPTDSCHGTFTISGNGARVARLDALTYHRAELRPEKIFETVFGP